MPVAKYCACLLMKELAASFIPMKRVSRGHQCTTQRQATTTSSLCWQRRRCAHTSYNGWNGEFFSCPAEMTILSEVCLLCRHVSCSKWAGDLCNGSNKTPNFCSDASNCSTQEIHKLTQPGGRGRVPAAQLRKLC